MYSYNYHTETFYFLFATTAAGVVPCGGPKKSPRTSSKGIRVVSPVGRFAGSFRPESFRPGFMGGSFRPY